MENGNDNSIYGENGKVVNALQFYKQNFNNNFFFGNLLKLFLKNWISQKGWTNYNYYKN